MNSNPLISVIIPVYNTEFWLPKCVKSVIKQTLSNIEIILVDDGSPDGCPELCDKLAKKDKRIRVIHKQNGGVSSARNAGINASQGEHITFIDADDWLTPNALELLYKGIKENDAQIAVGEMKNVTRRENTMARNISQSAFVDFNDSKTLTTEHLNECVADGVTGKLYKASVIKDNDILFKQGVKFAEDAIFHLNCVKHSDKIALSTGIVYVYNKLEFESATTKYYLEITDWMAELAKTRFDVLSGKNLDKNLFENYISYNAFEELFFIVIYCVQKCDNPNITKEMCRHYFENVSQYFFNNTEVKEKQRIYEYCKNNDYDGLHLHINKVLIANNDPTFLTRLKRVLGKLYLNFKIIRYRYF